MSEDQRPQVGSERDSGVGREHEDTSVGEPETAPEEASEPAEAPENVQKGKACSAADTTAEGNLSASEVSEARVTPDRVSERSTESDSKTDEKATQAGGDSQQQTPEPNPEADESPQSDDPSGEHGETPGQPRLDSTESYAQELLERSKEQLKRDEAELRKYEQLLEDCSSAYEDLRSRIETLREESARIRATTEDALSSSEETVKQALESSFKGLSLIMKMIDRLPQRIPAVEKMESRKVDLKTLDEERVRSLSDKEGEVYVSEVEKANYGLVAERRQEADDTRNSFIAFVKQHVLTIIDGIEDGKSHFDGQKRSLESQSPDARPTLGQWFGAYDRLSELMDELLQGLDIARISPERGEAVDYDSCEPFDVTQDSDLKNESVYEVVRPGYRYNGNLFETAPLVRPAQVIVVKNE